MRFQKIIVLAYAFFHLQTFMASPAWAAKAAPPKPASGPVKLEFSHRLDEVQAENLDKLISVFNEKNKDVQVALVRRVEGEQPKHLNLVTTEEYENFVSRKAKFKPLNELMREAKSSLDPSKFSVDLRGNAKGQMLALPVAFSTPVLYYNRAAFKAAGLDPDSPPKTWIEAQKVAGKLADAGSACPFTVSWPAWVMVDNLSAWNGAPVENGKKNLAFNGLVQVKHVAMMATWHKSRYFVYLGRRDEGDFRFDAGECAMLASSSSLYATLRGNKNLDFGVSTLPYHDDEYGTPQNTLADGASLWVVAGLKPDETKAVAKFVNFILDPETQIKLTVIGGYLPMTPVARAAASSKLLKEDLEGLHVAYHELKGSAQNPSLRVAQIAAVRAIVEEELEAVWANRKPAKQALDDAVERGNAALKSQSAAPAKKKK